MLRRNLNKILLGEDINEILLHKDEMRWTLFLCGVAIGKLYYLGKAVIVNKIKTAWNWEFWKV